MSAPDHFRGKAAHYARYRVDYPARVIRAAMESVALTGDDVVVDLGAGTGMLSRWFLEAGNRVFAVEPDQGMREVAEAALRQSGDRFVSVAGTAERTSLPDSSATLIVAGNAFHYFDPRVARVEAARVLQPGGRVLIVGHDSASEPNAFMRAYLDFIAAAAPEKIAAFHQADRVARALRTFFGGDTFDEHAMGDQEFSLTWDGLQGRFLSTSVAPAEGARREGVLTDLAALFSRFEQGGVVPFQLRWRYIWSQLRR